jgi:hypothetical protein
MTALAQEYEDRMAKAIAEATAHMSNKDIADQIGEIEAKRNETLYHLKYSSADVRMDSELLWQLRTEQDRRASLPVSLATATDQFCDLLTIRYGMAAE